MDLKPLCNIDVVEKLEEIQIDPTFKTRNFRLKLGLISKEISIKISKKYGRWSAKSSHDIHTPTQGGPYQSRNTYRDGDTALTLAVTGFVHMYLGAIKQGHEPKDSWLVP